MNSMTRSTLTVATLVLGVLPALAATETREATGFSALSLAAPIRVDLILGDRESVVLEGAEALLAQIETTVEKGALRIRRKPGPHAWSPGWNQNEVRARVTARRIDAVAIAGSGDIVAPQLTGSSLAISIVGSGDVTIGGGKVANLAVDIAGSGDVRAGRLDADSVAISISGSGDATVWARQSLSVHVAGSGDVKFYGDPAVSKRVAGSGEVRRLGAAPS